VEANHLFYNSSLPVKKTKRASYFIFLVWLLTKFLSNDKVWSLSFIMILLRIKWLYIQRSYTIEVWDFKKKKLKNSNIMPRKQLISLD
jgi:hypothetical protein